MIYKSVAKVNASGTVSEMEQQESDSNLSKIAKKFVAKKSYGTIHEDGENNLIPDRPKGWNHFKFVFFTVQTQLSFLMLIKKILRIIKITMSLETRNRNLRN